MSPPVADPSLEGEASDPEVLPPFLPRSDARSWSPPKPCSDETRLSGVPSACERKNEDVEAISSRVAERFVDVSNRSEQEGEDRAP